MDELLELNLYFINLGLVFSCFKINSSPPLHTYRTTRATGIFFIFGIFGPNAHGVWADYKHCNPLYLPEKN